MLAKIDPFIFKQILKIAPGSPAATPKNLSARVASNPEFYMPISRAMVPQAMLLKPSKGC